MPDALSPSRPRTNFLAGPSVVSEPVEDRDRALNRGALVLLGHRVELLSANEAVAVATVLHGVNYTWKDVAHREQVRHDQDLVASGASGLGRGGGIGERRGRRIWAAATTTAAATLALPSAGTAPPCGQVHFTMTPSVGASKGVVAAG